MFKAFKNIMKNWLKFDGRTSRREYWLAYLANIIIAMIYGVIMGIFVGVATVISEDFGGIALVISYIPLIIYGIWLSIAFIAAAIRRFHDQGKSGMMYLWCFLGSLCCGIGSIALIVFMCLPGTQGPNEYGPDPNGFSGQTPGYGQQPNMYNQNMNMGAGMAGGMNNMYGQQPNNNMYGQQPKNDNMYGNGQY